MAKRTVIQLFEWNDVIGCFSPDKHTDYLVCQQVMSFVNRTIMQLRCSLSTDQHLGH